MNKGTHLLVLHGALDGLLDELLDGSLVAPAGRARRRVGSHRPASAPAPQPPRALAVGNGIALNPLEGERGLGGLALLLVLGRGHLVARRAHVEVVKLVGAEARPVDGELAAPVAGVAPVPRALALPSLLMVPLLPPLLGPLNVVRDTADPGRDAVHDLLDERRNLGSRGGGCLGGRRRRGCGRGHALHEEDGAGLGLLELSQRDLHVVVVQHQAAVP